MTVYVLAVSNTEDRDDLRVLVNGEQDAVLAAIQAIGVRPALQAFHVLRALPLTESR